VDTAEVAHVHQRRKTVHRGCRSLVRLLGSAHTHEPAAVPGLERFLVEHSTTLDELDVLILSLSDHGN
jgi:hypothetical protein